ncbi:hypothetical protein BDZ91DRAFT_755141 [Kalaharituber pfeilii]|nr:hypothetical protein BDZ91DRAFT_755141 [Kalaharituber pfeilii]
MHPFQACIPPARVASHLIYFLLFLLSSCLVPPFRNYPYQSLAVFSCRTMTPAAHYLHT